MAMKRIQFQPGLSLPTFIEQFGTEAPCAAALERARWPPGFRCPGGGQAGHYRLQGGTHNTFQCHTRRRQTSLTAGTLFQSAPLALTVVPGHLPDQPGEDRPLGVGLETATGRQLPHRRVAPAKADAGYG